MPSDKFQTTQAKDITKARIGHGLDKVGNKIDSLTSSSLKRVLKAVCCVYAGEEILDRNPPSLREDEKGLIDTIYALQEEVLGFMQIREESTRQPETGLAFNNKEQENKNE